MTDATTQRPQRERSAGRLLLRLLMLVPIFLCWIGTLVLPTVRTLTSSFQDVNLLRPGAGEFVGWANYDQLQQDPTFASATGFTLSLATSRVLLIAIVPMLLALAASAFSRRVRVSVRLLFTIPLALFGPVGAALAWRLALSPQLGLAGNPESGLSLVSPELAPATLRLVDSLSSFGIACGIGLIVYGAALRGAGSAAPVWGTLRRPLLVTWIVVMLGSIALALQSFSLSFLLTRGGPQNSTTTLALLHFISGFQFFKFGVAGAVGMQILLPLGVLGMAAGLLIILAGLQIESVPPGKPPVQLSGSSRPIVALALGVLLIGCLVISAIGIWPLFWTAINSLKHASEIFAGEGSLLPATPTFDAYRTLDEQFPTGRILFNTVLPPLLGLAIQIPIAYLGALGIGALRPLGRHSEWLLLPFCPWLFVGIGPLSILAFENLRAAGLIDTFLSLVPPILCSVPMLVILTLFFKGQQARRSAPGASFFNALILPSLPLTVLLASIAFLVESQMLDWPLLVANSLESQPASVVLATIQGVFALDVPLLSAAMVRFGLPFFVLFFLIFAIFQIFYVDRLAITSEAQSE
jgi:ABC-type sugar transport system permease subunit